MKRAPRARASATTEIGEAAAQTALAFTRGDVELLQLDAARVVCRREPDAADDAALPLGDPEATIPLGKRGRDVAELRDLLVDGQHAVRVFGEDRADELDQSRFVAIARIADRRCHPVPIQCGPGAAKGTRKRRTERRSTKEGSAASKQDRAGRGRNSGERGRRKKQAREQFPESSHDLTSVRRGLCPPSARMCADVCRRTTRTGPRTQVFQANLGPRR